ncbi:transcription antitermination factor NusB [Natranaerobius trueperi]|uniref:Transcription antitermination protein NusB n=1 Tax=Natranaerobius trueperi TaxID=759412 RepID=A0A226C0X6_9FIRM|nr:transcription antitermination factor NusB [Natranaerobius trueperi]OWZ84020.1 hypothetical protein CDO51_05535 [Natranaerobius trueperi]
MSRRFARETAMKIIFQMAFNNDELNYEGAQQYKESGEEQLDVNNYQYLEDVTSKASTELPIIDSHIDKMSENWKIERLSRVDLSIMRLAICEMIYFDDIPVRVSINEAVELAKKFSTDKASSYINGILDKIAEQLKRDR